LPVYITRVEEADGQVLYKAQPAADKILSPQTAFLMNDMLSDVVDHGTAWKARQLGFKLPAAGKTGTTNEYRDAWFVGYTPRLVTGVWVGFDQPQTIIGGGYAAEVAVPMWASFMKRATSGDPADWYKTPSGVVAADVCRISGKRPVNGCYGAVVESEDGSLEQASTVYREYFVKGAVPNDECPIHSVVHLEARRAESTVWTMPRAPLSDARPTLSTSRAPHEDERRIDTPRAQDPEVKEPEKKKRGFWSRLFGRGDKENEKENDKETKESREKENKESRANRPPG
jgi:penicillin-binding protein 1A